jgi:hypothetical protein
VSFEKALCAAERLPDCSADDSAWRSDASELVVLPVLEVVPVDAVPADAAVAVPGAVAAETVVPDAVVAAVPPLPLPLPRATASCSSWAKAA